MRCPKSESETAAEKFPIPAVLVFREMPLETDSSDTRIDMCFLEAVATVLPPCTTER